MLFLNIVYNKYSIKFKSNGMKSTEVIKIFLSSPSDVLQERQRIIDIANELNKSLGFHLKKSIMIIGWENVSPSIASYAQQVINQEINDYDIFLGVFGLRFGTPTPNAGSGTEEEFDIAIKKYERTEIKDVCMFFKQDGFVVGDIDVQQLAEVQKFKNKISKLGCYRVDFLVKDFDEEIRKLLVKLLVNWEAISQKIISPIDKHHTETIEDLGYYDAIYQALEELNGHEDVVSRLINTMKSFSQEMVNTKFQLDNSINEKMRINTINNFAEEGIRCAANLEMNISKEKVLFYESLKKFDIAAKILAEDFIDGKDQLKDIIPILEKNRKTYQDRVLSSQKIIIAIDQYPRATTKLNNAKKKLLRAFREVKDVSECLALRFTESLEYIKNYL